MSKMLSKNSKALERVELSEIGLYLRVISREYPEVKDYDKLAQLISEEFNVICESDLIRQYEELEFEHRDFVDRIYHAIAMGYLEKPDYEW